MKISHITLFCITYLSLIIFIYYTTGYPVYPFLANLTIVEFIVTYIKALVLCLIGHYIYYFLTIKKVDKLIDEEEMTRV